MDLLNKIKKVEDLFKNSNEELLSLEGKLEKDSSRKITYREMLTKELDNKDSNVNEDEGMNTILEMIESGEDEIEADRESKEETPYYMTDQRNRRHI